MRKCLSILLLCMLLVLADRLHAETFGPNIAVNPSFETLGDNGLPVDWSCTDNPKGNAVVDPDPNILLTGKVSFRMQLPKSGCGISLRSKPIPVEGGKQYLFSIGFRSEGFGAPRKYSGVDAYSGLDWLDAAGKFIARGDIIAFPYHALDWDLRDHFVTAPPGAGQLVITVNFSNNSEKVNKENIPSSLWLDGIQIRSYSPPPTPEWALKPPDLIVEGGWSTARVIMPQPGSLHMAGGQWSPIVPDTKSTFGMVLASPPNVGRGMMCHSPYYMNPKAGLYRVVIRCKVQDNTGKEKAGFMDIDSQFASQRAILNLYPKDFTAPDAFQEFPVDFVLRNQGYWDFRVSTEGKQTFTVDSVKVFPVMLFTDNQLLDIYPGSDGIVPVGLQPKHDGPFTALLVAGMMYDDLRIVDAFRLTDYAGKLTTVWVQKSNTQAFVGFPDTPEELFKYRLIYFCDVDTTSFTLRQKRMLVEYVRRGGGLIVLGGHKSFERGGIPDSLLDELMPVNCPKGELPPLLYTQSGAPLAKGIDHPLTEFLDFTETPLCFYQHNFTMREGAQTILTSGGKPAVVIGRAGKGRVACVGLTCFGDPAEGKTPFWKWSGWPTFLRDLSWWTAGDDQHFNAK
ncbi:MAG: glutamine amidotransferase [Armatimonadota bacterium]